MVIRRSESEDEQSRSPDIEFRNEWTYTSTAGRAFRTCKGTALKMPEFTRYLIYLRNFVSHSIGINYPCSRTYTPLPLSDPHLFKQVDSKLHINNLARKFHILNSGCNVIWRKWQDRLEAIRAGKMGKENSVPPSRCHRAFPGFQDSGARATYRCKKRSLMLLVRWCYPSLLHRME